MDGNNFDALARSFARDGTRRGFLKKMAGATALVVAGRPLAAAAGCPPGQVPASGNRCVCKSTGRPPGPTGCGCGAGQTDCGGTCKDLSSDAANCGACGVACPDPQQICRAGQCWCPPGLTLCGARCVDLQTDPDNCGACATVCPGPIPGTCQGDRICVSASCTFTPLPVGTECRAVAGICDVAETCDGTSLDCPPDAFAPSTQLCRDVAGDCDLPEYCTGNGPNCPPDAFKGPDTVCRQADGACNPEERCTGASPNCPADTGQAGELCEDICCTAPLVCIVDAGINFVCGSGGGNGQPCRYDGERIFCDPGLTCIPGPTGSAPICRPCGNAGEPCCNRSCGEGLQCESSFANPAGTCRPCGGPGEPCCGGLEGTCDAGLECQLDFSNPSNITATCGGCGGVDQRCCGVPGPLGTCDANLVCTFDPDNPFDSRCRQCGLEGGPCCGGPQGTCDPGSACVPATLEGLCVPCGGQDEVCCGFLSSTPSCDAGMTCIVRPGAVGICRPCGEPGQDCCATEDTATCNPGAFCNLAGACIACGGPGEVCCFDFFGSTVSCDAGLECGTNGLCGADTCGRQGQPCCVDFDTVEPYCDGSLTCVGDDEKVCTA